MKEDKGRIKFEGLEKIISYHKKKNKEVLPNGTIVYCRGNRRNKFFYWNSI